MVWAEGRECDVCARVRLGGSTAPLGGIDDLFSLEASCFKERRLEA